MIFFWNLSSSKLTTSEPRTVSPAKVKSSTKEGSATLIPVVLANIRAVETV